MSQNAGASSDSVWNFGQNPTFSGQVTAGTNADDSGKGLFKYQPPSGFLALCEDNLPTPAIPDPGEHFKTVLYTGDGASGRSITGIGFTPDLVWIKSRSNAYNHGLQDSVRGIGKVLYSNLTNTEDTGSVSLTSFASNGFGLGNDSWNGSGANYVAWCWKAGAGTTSTNTDGSITSVVSVNQDAGFSIVSYTGNGSAGTIGHGLGKTPAFVITKHRNLDTHWRIWHKSLTAYNYTLFFNTGAQQIQPAYSALPTSSVINLDSDLTGAYNFVTYCWSEIEGYSKFGSYIGNGSTDGRMVWCGFKPAWVMIKASSGTTNGWVIMDNARSSSNPSGQTIYAHNSNIETTDLNLREMDFVSNGFKIRAGGGTERNANGATYIFAAFAESPFQTANAK